MMLREFVAEITARGWRAFAFGPEVHLFLPFVYGAVLCIAMIAGSRGRKK